jgi:HJR/Mrr/RecB family endonuclease
MPKYYNFVILSELGLLLTTKLKKRFKNIVCFTETSFLWRKLQIKRQESDFSSKRNQNFFGRI